MIRLMVSDVDGTLLHGNQREIPGSTLELMEECIASGIRFAVASGRQYNNLKRLFAPLWEELYFIPENGNVIFYRDEILHQVTFPQDIAQELIAYLGKDDVGELMVSTPHTVFLLNPAAGFEQAILNGVRYTTTCIEDPGYLVHENIVKIGIYVHDTSRIPSLIETYEKDWGYHLQVTKSGGRWIDFSLSGKGAAVRRLADDFQIPFENIMVFGDNYNDEEMFRAAKHSYVMEKADDYLKTKAAYTTDSVEKVIAHFLETGDIWEG